MPKHLQYGAGSIIYFQGDLADKVFILQKGSVDIIYQNIETTEDQHDRVQPGEFFGLKAALGRYPRDENAIALTDTVTLAFTVTEFEAFAAANTRIIMKMLKVFSNELRRIHKQVNSLMSKEEQDPEEGLFNLGEHYFKNGRFEQAGYVFNRYLTYYPSGKNAIQAARNLRMTERSLGRGMAPQPGQRARGAEVPAAGLSAAAGAYQEAMNLISQAKYQEACAVFKRILEANEDPGYAAKSACGIGRCFFLMGKYEECITYGTMMITKNPKHPCLGEALFLMGQSYEKSGRKEKAADFYRKILSLPESPEDHARAKAGQALKDLGV